MMDDWTLAKLEVHLRCRLLMLPCQWKWWD